MDVLRRVVACALLIALAIASSANFPVVPVREDARSSRRSVLSESLPPAEAFTELVAALVTARGTPFRPPLLRAAPKAGLRGIDVSHYQGRIDWARVASSGHYFVIAKATEGRTWIDGSYLRNKANAEAHHLAFGAYHFARPDRGPYDAVREANHFLDVARLEPGNVIPVLDLESTGGLSQRRLTRWILTWLRRVRERLGVRPMVYTSPLGWVQLDREHDPDRRCRLRAAVGRALGRPRADAPGPGMGRSRVDAVAAERMRSGARHPWVRGRQPARRLLDGASHDHRSGYDAALGPGPARDELHEPGRGLLR